MLTAAYFATRSAKHGGIEIDCQGDGFFVAFQTASEAVRAAVGIAARAVGASLARGRRRACADRHPHRRGCGRRRELSGSGRASGRAYLHFGARRPGARLEYDSRPRRARPRGRPSSTRRRPGPATRHGSPGAPLPAGRRRPAESLSAAPRSCYPTRCARPWAGPTCSNATPSLPRSTHSSPPRRRAASCWRSKAQRASGRRASWLRRVDGGRDGGACGFSLRGARSSSSAFSYGVVRQLFEPVLRSAPEEERTELLAGAAGLAGPIFDPAHFGAELDAEGSQAMLHGLFWVTANLADQQPLLLALDDLHWCDPPSLRWLTYLLPRMEGSAGTDRGGAQACRTKSGRRIVGEGDDRSAIDRVEAGSAQRTGDRTVARQDRLSRRRRGVPGLAARGQWRESVARSGARERNCRRRSWADGCQRIAPERARRPRGVPRRRGCGSPGFQQTPRGSLERSRCLAATPTSGSRPRWAGLELEAASEAAADLGRTEILEPNVPLAFVHPVVRAAVYAELSPVERSRGHTRAARLLAESGAEPERVAAQLLLTTPTGDAWATSTLRDAARSALGRGAPDSAVVYLRRALEEASPPEPEAVLHELGTAEARMADPEAIEHLAAARAAAG